MRELREAGVSIVRVVEQRQLVAAFHDATAHKEVDHAHLNDLRQIRHVGVSETCEWVKDSRIVVRHENAVNHDGMQMRVESQVRADSLYHTDRSTLTFDGLLVAQM